MAQTLLKSFTLPWTDTAEEGWTMRAWQVFTVHRRVVTTPGMWLFEELHIIPGPD